MPHPAGVRKLTLNVSPQIGDRLEELAKRKGITVTEYLRRAIATQSLIDKAFETYGELTVIADDTKQPVHHFNGML